MHLVYQKRREGLSPGPKSCPGFPSGAVFESIFSSCPTVPCFSGHMGLGPIPLTCPQRVAGASNFLVS